MQSGTGTYYDDLHHTRQMTVKADNVGTTEEKLEEDWGAMSSAAGKMNMTNTTTKAQVMKVITAAQKTEPKQNGNRSAK